MSNYEYTVHKFEMLDTGIGQELGYEDDKAMFAAARAKRENLDPEVRKALEDHEREVLRRTILGDA